MAIKYKGEIMSSSEIKKRKARDKKLNANEVSLSLVWTYIRWFGRREDNLPIIYGRVKEDKGSYIITENWEEIKKNDLFIDKKKN